MATAKEESIIEKVERELKEFTDKKSVSESLLKEELTKAKIEYDNLVKDINLKHKVEEYDLDIKKHSYFLKLLKGEIAIPDDLNVKKSNIKKPKPEGERVPFPKNFTIPASYEAATTDNQKVYWVISEAENSLTIDQIQKAINKIGHGFDKKKITNIVNSLENKFQVVVRGEKVGRELTYKTK